jgi:mannose-6-phosphate isomerase-like protein (cupin superfamily)
MTSTDATTTDDPAGTESTVVSTDELRRRTILRSDWVPCKAAFIDCRTPGSDQKDNYSFIGPGVSQNADQFVNLKDPHGFNLGAAGMPKGVTNNLHLHFTAEVFINFGGTFRLRWGADGGQGEFVSRDGDIVSVPTWIFRGFTNEGADDGILMTILGHDDTGGIIWGPSVLKQAAEHGLYLSADNRLIDTVAGDVIDDDVRLITPMDQVAIDKLDVYTPEEFRERVVTPGDRRFVEHPFLCSGLPGGGVHLAPVIGYGMVEDRRAAPQLHEQHSFSAAWLRGRIGDGMLSHRHDRPQVVTVKSGTWRVHVNEGEARTHVDLGPLDSFSVPAGAWRSLEVLDTAAGQAAMPDTAELLVVCAGDDRVRLDWAPEVVHEAAAFGQVLDANGYVSPASVIRSATDDD